MKPWKKLEEFIADYLGWTRLTKKSYGDSIPDLKGDGYTGDAKHYKKMRIISLSDEMNFKYKKDIILFLKKKGEHYTGKNIRVLMNLDQFVHLLYCKRIAETIDNKNINLVDNRLTILLKDMSYNLESIKLSYQKMKKIIKKMKEVK